MMGRHELCDGYNPTGECADWEPIPPPRKPWWRFWR